MLEKGLLIKMKILFLFVLLILIIPQNGCKQTTEPAVSDMYVLYEIESAFQDDAVKLTLDDRTLIESKVTTNYTISLAWSSGFQKLTRTGHIINFAVPEYGIQSDFNINAINDTSSVLIRFDKESKQISIEQIKGVILRD